MEGLIFFAAAMWLAGGGCAVARRMKTPAECRLEWETMLREQAPYVEAGERALQTMRGR